MNTCPACDSPVAAGAETCTSCGLVLTAYRLLLGLPDGFFNAALEHARAGDLDAAIESLTVAAALSPDDAEAELLLGRLYFKRSQVKRAHHHLRRALAIQERLKAPEAAVAQTRALLAPAPGKRARRR